MQSSILESNNIKRSIISYLTGIEADKITDEHSKNLEPLKKQIKKVTKEIKKQGEDIKKQDDLKNKIQESFVGIISKNQLEKLKNPEEPLNSRAKKVNEEIINTRSNISSYISNQIKKGYDYKGLQSCISKRFEKEINNATKNTVKNLLKNNVDLKDFVKKDKSTDEKIKNLIEKSVVFKSFIELLSNNVVSENELRPAGDLEKILKDTFKKIDETRSNVKKEIYEALIGSKFSSDEDLKKIDKIFSNIKQEIDKLVDEKLDQKKLDVESIAKKLYISDLEQFRKDIRDKDDNLDRNQLKEYIKNIKKEKKKVDIELKKEKKGFFSKLIDNKIVKIAAFTAVAALFIAATGGSALGLLAVGVGGAGMVAGMSGRKEGKMVANIATIAMLVAAPILAFGLSVPALACAAAMGVGTLIAAKNKKNSKVKSGAAIGIAAIGAAIALSVVLGPVLGIAAGIAVGVGINTLGKSVKKNSKKWSKLNDKTEPSKMKKILGVMLSPIITMMTAIEFSLKKIFKPKDKQGNLEKVYFKNLMNKNHDSKFKYFLKILSKVVFVIPTLVTSIVSRAAKNRVNNKEQISFKEEFTKNMESPAKNFANFVVATLLIPFKALKKLIVSDEKQLNNVLDKLDPEKFKDFNIELNKVQIANSYLKTNKEKPKITNITEFKKVIKQNTKEMKDHIKELRKQLRNTKQGEMTTENFIIMQQGLQDQIIDIQKTHQENINEYKKQVNEILKTSNLDEKTKIKLQNHLKGVGDKIANGYTRNYMDDARAALEKEILYFIAKLKMEPKKVEKQEPKNQGNDIDNKQQVGLSRFEREQLKNEAIKVIKIKPQNIKSPSKSSIVASRPHSQSFSQNSKGL